MKKKTSYPLFEYSLFFLLLLLYSCAQIVPLSGGEKDVTPPQEVRSVPLNKSVNFDVTTITIEFNEFIQLMNLNSQLIISPIINPKPEVLAKGKKLILKLPNNLAPNTTYSINFGNAICDITENNSFPNYKFVFSTGNFLDSLSYSGNILNASNLAPEEKIYVLLYKQYHDSVPLKELPNYIALTNKEGQYELTNIAKGKYKLFALKDINSNYLYDLPNEKIGFKEDIIHLTSSQANNQIYLFEETHQKQYIKEVAHKQYGKVDIAFNQPPKDLKITPLNIPPEEISLLEEKNEKEDSLTLWLKLNNELPFLDLLLSDKHTLNDTIRIKRVQELKDSALIIQSNITSNFDLNQPILLTANRPVVEIDTQKVQLLEDSISVNFSFTIRDKSSRKFMLQYAFKENTSYQLLIPSFSATDIYGLHNDSISLSFTTKSAEDYGNILLTLTPNFEEQYIIQLFMDKKLVSENSYSTITKTTYKYLRPGIYHLKLIIDTNQNGKWDTGDYFKNQQPEKVILYKKEINIRANWDNEINWKINE
ncbi:MAG: Ig-like domain-containing protein [Vicingus serpentipes]|nr:Ig-like domain-containing protein [Vicingus serpentipes]